MMDMCINALMCYMIMNNYTEVIENVNVFSWSPFILLKVAYDGVMIVTWKVVTVKSLI